MTDVEKITSTHIRAALLKFYAPPSHRCFFEVSNDTGANVKRWIDALAVGIWPSTGYEIVGIEIKVSRADWKVELSNPAKSQALMKYCTRWFLAAPEGLIKPDEIPATWGMLAYRDGSVRVKVPAKLLEPEPLTPGFMMAVLRQSNGIDGEVVAKLVEERMAERAKSFDKEVERACEYKVNDVARKHESALSIAKKLTEAVGEDFNNWTFDPKALGAAYKMLKATGLHDNHGYGSADIPGIISHLKRAQDGLEKIYGLPAFAQLRDLKEIS